MIAHFRRYQRIIYIIVTVVIVISFSFFGTYSSITRSSSGDVCAAVLIDGTEVSKAELMRHMAFLGTSHRTSAEGQKNPMNAGFLERAILGSPFGDELMLAVGASVEGDFRSRFEKEKQFKLYQHPSASFLNADQVWGYFAPNLRECFLKLQQAPAEIPIQELYAIKKQLYLAEQAFPATYLKQILLYQEGQYSWVDKDPALPSRSMSLFGYSGFEGWFGQKFLASSVLAILNTAEIARREGFSVSYDEARRVLYGNIKTYVEQFSYETFSSEDELAAAVDEQLRRALVSYGIDESEAVEMIRTLLLFDRAVSEIPTHLATSAAPFASFVSESAETVEVRKYILPEELRAQSMRDLVEVQLWIDSVSSEGSRGAAGLDLPARLLPAKEVAAKTPQLVQQRFSLSVAHVKREDLRARVLVRDIWAWLADDANWACVTEKYPQLLEKKAGASASRIQAYDAIEPKLKNRIDLFARDQIVEAHQKEWVKAALDSAAKEPATVSIRLSGGEAPFDGIEDPSALLHLLVQAPIGVPSKELLVYNQSPDHFYSILVLDRSESEIVPLLQARRDGVLGKMVDASLEKAYNVIRAQKKRKEFQKEDGSFREFQEVKDILLSEQFSQYRQQLIEAARKEELQNAPWNLYAAKPSDDELAVQARYMQYMQLCCKKMKGSEGKEQEEGNMPESAWRPSEAVCSIHRGELRDTAPFLIGQIFGRPAGFCTDIYYDRTEGSLAFAIVEKRVPGGSAGALFETLKAVELFLGEEALQQRSQFLMQKMGGSLRLLDDAAG